MNTFEVEGVGGGESVENEPETVIEQQFQNDFVFDLPKQSTTSEADISIPWGADPFRHGDLDYLKELEFRLVRTD